jgi:predicted acyl esterase
MSEETAPDAGMRIDWDVPITVDDGLVLRADVFRPDDGERHPVIVTYGPYAKGLHFEDGYPDQWHAMCAEHADVAAGSSNRYQAWELPDPEKWVPHGYVCLRVDSRGAGSSPGVIDPFSARETQDFYHCIEWAAEQPWSNGRIGLSGISYYAINQWQVAAQRPPHLAAICVWEGAADWYRDSAHHGGILCTFSDNWYRHQVESVQHGVGERGGRSRATGALVTGEQTLSAQELAANRVDFGADVREHALVDEYFAPRIADLARIEVPVLSAGNWGGHGLHLRGNTEGFMRAGSERKWLEIHGLAHWTHYYTDYGREIQRQFLDRFLKDADNGWDERPAVSLNIRHVDGTFVPRGEQAWPIPRTRWTKLHLDAASRSLSPQPVAEPATLSYPGMGDGVTFSWRLDSEIEITGPLAAKLFVSSASEDADLFLIVRAFDERGREVTFQGALEPHSPIAHGWLRGSQRKLDRELTLPYRPYHTHDERQPLTPGEIYELDIEIWPTCVVLPAGYTLALSVQGVDYRYSDRVERFGWFEMSGVGPFKHDVAEDRPPSVFGAEVTLHTGGRTPAYLLLPIVPAA